MDSTRPEASVVSTARILLQSYGLRRAVQIAEAQSAAIAATSPVASLHFAEVGRHLERSFVAADMAAAGVRVAA